MKHNVICNICGHHQEVDGEVKAEQYFPTKYVYVNNAVVKCPKCYDRYFTIENQDYVSLFCKTGITGDNKEFIRKSNEVYIDNTIAFLYGKLHVLKQDSNKLAIAKLEKDIAYWETTKVINSKA